MEENRTRKTYTSPLVKLDLVRYSVYAMLFSFFYNLPVIKYSVKGDNEFRLYDVAGLLIFYIYMKYYKEITSVIKTQKTYLYLHQFLQWTTFSLLFSLVFCLSEGRMVWWIQSCLYIYHFWTFYLAGVLLVIYISDLDQLKKIVSWCLVFGIITFLIVILQNFGIIPFLWSDKYLVAYNFLSGTLGPNKIVLGMTCVFVFVLSLALFNEKRVKINKVLLLLSLGFSFLTLVISGSRTAYVSLLIFLAYLFIRDTKKFMYSSVVMLALGYSFYLINPIVIEKAIEVYEKRVENKIQSPEALQEARVDDLYEDLGSGRKELSLMYVDYLLENPIYIPFGIGFNNRIYIGSSAHNMYLTLINEVGIVGWILYFRWLVYFLFIKMRHFEQMEIALKGLILSSLVSLFFGEHLYVYRPLFGLLGLFLFVTTILLSPHYNLKNLSNEKENE